MSDERPDEKWSLERLGGFCSRSRERLAVEAWRFGHALNLAKSKQPHGAWKSWKQKYVPGLGHSSEYRYRNLAERIGEDAMHGIGLTEAYRLLDLPCAGDKEPGDPFAQAPRAVVVGAGGVPPDEPAVGELDEDDPGDADDLAASPRPATGWMEVAPEDAPPRTATGPVEAEAEPAGAAPPAAPLPAGERYRLDLLHARAQLESLDTWADWLSRQDEGFRIEMWYAHCPAGVAAQIEATVEKLRWVADNLEW